MEKKNNGLVVLVVILIILVLGLGGFIFYDKVLSNNDGNNNSQPSEINENGNSGKENSNANVLSEIQKVYDDAYSAVNKVNDYNIVSIQVGEEGTVGGVETLKAYKMNFSLIEKYFTDRAMNIIKVYYTDTPYGHKDGNYYIFAEETKRSYDKKEFDHTIFGTTDQSKRTLKLIYSNESEALAVSEKSSFLGENEYVYFKKVNNEWKIDMFEEF